MARLEENKCGCRFSWHEVLAAVVWIGTSALTIMTVVYWSHNVAIVTNYNMGVYVLYVMGAPVVAAALLYQGLRFLFPR